jgi:hypothetical protein
MGSIASKSTAEGKSCSSAGVSPETTGIYSIGKNGYAATAAAVASAAALVFPVHSTALKLFFTSKEGHTDRQ